jgi:hypothetical protein
MTELSAYIALGVARLFRERPIGARLTGREIAAALGVSASRVGNALAWNGELRRALPWLRSTSGHGYWRTRAAGN